MNMTETSTLEAFVARGVAYLDGRYPAWRWRVDPDIIEPGCADHSIAGQLFGGDVRDQLRAVGLPDVMTLGTDDDAMIEGARIMREFCDMGFATMIHVPFFPSAEARAEMMAATGTELPAIIQIPRDRDVCVLELATLQMLWQREVNKR